MLAATVLFNTNATISDDASLLADAHGRRVPCRGRDRPRRRGRHFRRRRDLPVSDLREMGRRIQKGDRCRVTYRPIGSGDGIRQIQDKEVTFGASDMPLNAADLDAAWAGAIPDRRRRHRGRGEYRRHQDRRPHPGRSDPGQDLPRRDQVVEPRGAAQAQSEREAAVAADHRGAPLRRFRHDLRLHGLPLQDEPGLASPRSDRSPPSIGRSASGPGATKALPAPSRAPRARSAMSNTPMPSRTGSPTPR